MFILLYRDELIPISWSHFTTGVPKLLGLRIKSDISNKKRAKKQRFLYANFFDWKIKETFKNLYILFIPILD